jgi:16S rRNA (uracil1498-N3)-methyltransferase
MVDTLRRFFVPRGSIQARHVTLGPDLAHRLGRVLRLRAGDHVILTEGGAHEYEVQITAVSGNALTANVVAERQPPHEPDVEITLYQSLIRANRFDFVLEKGTEIGVARFVPITTARTIVQGNGEPSSARSERWTRLVTEAAEQCGRGRLPRIEAPMVLEDALRAATGLKLIPYEEERSQRLTACVRGLRARPQAVSLLIGPEGGFEESEVALARDEGWTPVSLGPRVMRSETAGIIAPALVLDALGELG